MTKIAPNLYQLAKHKFRVRIRLHGRRSWRTLKAQTVAAALKESVNVHWTAGTARFGATAALYVKSGCPTNHTKFKPAPDHFRDEESARCTRLVRYFGSRKLDTIELASLMEYAKFRTRGQPAGRGTRAVDKETQTLSNVLNFAVFITRSIAVNPIRSNRPRFHTIKKRARERMPESADAIHALANHFFGRVRTECHGWHCYLAMFTGCRTSELLRLRLDATDGQPGYVQRDFTPADISPLYASTVALLHLERSKAGINPWALVGPEFSAMLECFRRWHQQRFPENAFYLPSPYGGAMGEKQFGRALEAACAELEMPPVTPHGFRAYYATKRLRDQIPPAFVAAELGDKTVSLISTTYAETPGRGRLSWLPSEGLPAWLRWQPDSAKLAKVEGMGL